MLGPCDVIAFVATTDAARARAFYEDVLGLRLVSDEPFALVFDAHGTMLRIAKVPELTPPRHTVLGWAVADAKAMVTRLLAAGVEFERYEGLPQDALGVWTTPDGACVAWFRDPDGNTLSITQFLAAMVRWPDGRPHEVRAAIRLSIRLVTRLAGPPCSAGGLPLVTSICGQERSRGRPNAY